MVLYCTSAAAWVSLKGSEVAVGEGTADGGAFGVGPRVEAGGLELGLGDVTTAGATGAVGPGATAVCAGVAD